MLAQAGMPLLFWWDAFSSAVFLINRLPTSVLSNKCPFEMVYKKAPDLSLLNVFGVACYPHLRPYDTHKMEFRSSVCFYWLQ